MLALEGKLLPQKQIFGHESSSRLKSRPQELAEVKSETEENLNEMSDPSHSSAILPNGHRYGNGKDRGVECRARIGKNPPGFCTLRVPY